MKLLNRWVAPGGISAVYERASTHVTAESAIVVVRCSLEANSIEDQSLSARLVRAVSLPGEAHGGKRARK